MIVCQKCGTRNPDDRRWCSKCETFLDWDGEHVEGGGPQTAPVPEEPQPARRRAGWPLLLAGLVVLLGVAVLVFAFSGGSKKPKAITSSPTSVPVARPPAILQVSFSGNSSAPVVTVTGSNLGESSPQPQPGQSPPDVSSTCEKASSPDGLDYGRTGLNIADLSRNWRAGYDGPNDINCVGMSVLSWSPARVVFALGSLYTEEGYVLAPGDRYSLVLDGASASGTVTYGS